MALNARQEAFIHEYINHPDSLTKAVQAAGYRNKNPHATAATLLKHPAIQEGIRRQRERLRDTHQVTRDQLAIMLLETYHTADRVSDRLEAVRQLAVLYGFWPDARLR